MTDTKVPRIEPSHLRDHAADARVDRVWSRLESELAPQGRGPRATRWLVPAALVATFAGGIAVGSRMRPESTPLALSAEALPAGEQAVATSAQSLPAEPSAEAPPKRREPMPVRSVPVIARSPELVPPAPASALALAPAPAVVEDWQRLANQGDYEGARAAIVSQGGFSSVLERASADALMTLQEVARATGERAIALRALRRVVEKFPGDPNAPVAAYTLATQLQRSGDRTGAAEAFGAYRRLSPKGEFAEDALVRELDAAIERGDAARAEELAAQHARDYPNGRRRADIERKLGRLGGTPIAAGDAGVDEPLDDDEPGNAGAAASAAPAASAH